MPNFLSIQGKFFNSNSKSRTQMKLTDSSFYIRYHAVQEFNRGVFDYLIATDESGLEGHDRDTLESTQAEADARPTR